MTQTCERSARLTSLACESPSGPNWRRNYILLVGVLVGRPKHLIPTHPIPNYSMHKSKIPSNAWRLESSFQTYSIKILLSYQVGKLSRRLFSQVSLPRQMRKSLEDAETVSERPNQPAPNAPRLLQAPFPQPVTACMSMGLQGPFLGGPPLAPDMATSFCLLKTPNRIKPKVQPVPQLQERTAANAQGKN